MDRTEVTFQGNDITLVGDDVQPGDQAPNMRVQSHTGEPVELFEEVGEHVVLLMSVPSIDIPYFAGQVRTFDEHLPRHIGDRDIAVWVITSDQPRVLGQFVREYDIDNLELFSDYREGLFGQRFGVEVQEIGMLARSIFVIDLHGEIVYAEIPPDVTREPNYYLAVKAALGAVAQ